MHCGVCLVCVCSQRLQTSPLLHGNFVHPCVLAGPVSCPVQHSHIIVTDIRGFLLTKRSMNRARLCVVFKISTQLVVVSVETLHWLAHCKNLMLIDRWCKYGVIFTIVNLNSRAQEHLAEVLSVVSAISKYWTGYFTNIQAPRWCCSLCSNSHTFPELETISPDCQGWAQA